MSRPASALTLLVCFLLASSISEAQTTRRGASRSGRTCSIEGTVRDEVSNATLERVRVDLVADEGETIGSIFTDANGKFEFGSVHVGNYALHVYDPGYATHQEAIDCGLGSHRNIEISLKRSQSGQPQSSTPTISAHELSMPERARDAMEQGKKKLYEKKDPRGSLVHFERAVALAPNYYEAYYQMGVAQWQAGRLEEAEQSIRKSIETSGDKYAGADLGLGALLADRKQFGEAEKPLRRAAELEPSLWLAHYELGRTLAELNRMDEAQASAEQARTLKPDAPLVYRLLATIHLRQKNSAALVDDLNQYVKLDPNSPAGVRAKQMLEDLRKAPQTQETVAVPPKP